MKSIWSQRSSTKEQANVERFALLLAILIAMIALLGLVGVPREADDPALAVRIIVTLLSGGILFATIRVSRVSRQHEHWFAFAIVGVMILAIASFLVSEGVVLDRIVSVLWVLLVITAPGIVLKEVLSATEVSVQTILGSICVYLLIGLALTFLAIAMDGWGGFFEDPPRPTSFVYFSFVTITTLGYGDLAPYTDQARMVSVASAVSAQIYLVIVVARLVSIWTKPGDRDSQRA